ncbi:recombinase family protein [Klebsiella pasteurii]|uniref:recombinase family protein n=1 Tax=Klebsiella pasteurii TaxID=2587529 RepID=UPI0027EE1A45|nr:recombinase family protein [Klebsiella variicola]
MVKAYIYTRVSSLQQSDGFGIPRQIHTLMDFLENAELPKELGYQLDPNDYEVLEHDSGLSGYSGYNFLKGSIGKFKKRVASGEITSGCLLIESVDRFSRKQGYDAIDEFTFLIKRNIDIIEVETGQIFSYKLDHKLTQLSTSIERAYQESKRKSRMAVKSWANVKRKAVEEGIAISRNVPYWLEVKNNEYLIRSEHTNKIKRVFDMYINGVGVTSIVRELNKEGGKHDGGMYSTNFINMMLRDKRLLGWQRGKKKANETKEETEKRSIKIYPVIIKTEIFNLVQRKIDANKVSKSVRTSSKQKSLFNGVARCEICGEALVGHFSKGGGYLRCIGKRSKVGSCDSRLIKYSPFEESMIANLKNINFKEVYGSNSASEEHVKSIKNELLVVTAEYDEIEQLLNTSGSTIEIVALSKALREKSKEKDTLQSELIALTNNSVIENVDIDIGDLKNNTELREQYNIYLRKVIKEIKVKRVNDIVYAHIHYFTDKISHLYIVDGNDGTLLSSSHISDDLVFESEMLKIDLTKGEWIIKKDKMTQWDELAIDYWKWVIDEAIKVASLKE